MKLFYTTIILALFLSAPSWLYGQVKVKDRPPIEGKLYLTALPVISYNPAFGVIYGGAASAGIYLGHPDSTLMSSGSSTITYTSKKQLMFTLKPNIYTKNNEWYITGDGRLFFSSQPTYGLGTGPQANYIYSEGQLTQQPFENGIPSGQLMEFDLVRIYGTAFKKVKKGFYLGLGYHLDNYSRINDLATDTSLAEPQFSNHLLYSIKHGFDIYDYTISGFSVNAMYDTRDNMSNAYKGTFVSLNYRVMTTWLGSEKDASLLSYDARKFFSISKNTPRNVLAFWSYGHFTPTGKLPYMGLPALGYDQLGRSGRAYPQGRFRGDDLFYMEAEYRFQIPIIKKYPDLLGAVVFANVTSASSEDHEVKLFEYMKHGVGGGLRIMIQKEARANIVLDYGWGADGAGAFYVNINETF